MWLNTEYIDPIELTSVSRTEFERVHLNEDTMFFGQWFPNEYIDDVAFKFRPGGEFEDAVAEYRAWDTEAPIGGRPGGEEITGEIPPISRKTRLGEYDTLRRRRSPEEAIRNVIRRDARAQATQIARRLELGRAQALVTGQLLLNENGLILPLDYQRDPTHTTTPGTAWSNLTTSDPVSDLIAWRDRVELKGYAVDAIVTTRQVLSYMLRNTKIINDVKGSAMGATRVTQEQLNDRLAEDGLPSVTVYSANVAGGNPIGDNTLLMLPARGQKEVAQTLMGPTAEALEAPYDQGLGGDTNIPGLISGVYKKNDPVTLWTLTSAVGAPMLFAADATLAATVAS